jgi:hypothetical protein
MAERGINPIAPICNQRVFIDILIYVNHFLAPAKSNPVKVGGAKVRDLVRPAGSVKARGRTGRSVQYSRAAEGKARRLLSLMEAGP